MEYIIDSENQYFNTLKEVRLHLFLMSENDKMQYNNTILYCIKKNEVIKTKLIRISKKGKITFSRIKAKIY